MTRTIIRTEHAPASPVYSQGVQIGPHVYVSGMIGLDPVTKHMAGTTIEDQTRQAIRNCQAVLKAAGASLADVVQVTVLLTNPGDFAAMNAEYVKHFATDPPARAVTKLGVELPNVLISIQMTAYVSAA